MSTTPFFYHTKELTHERFADIVVEARTARKVSLEQAARAVHISPRYLQALEEGNYAALPQGIYVRTFIRQYCRYLRLDPTKMLALYEQEEGDSDKVAGVEAFRYQRVKQRYFLSLPKIVRNSILVVVVASIGLFLGIRVRAIIAPPRLDVSFPPPAYVTSERSIAVSGFASQDVRIFVNGEEVVVKDGAFSQVLYITRGINTVAVRAQKRYGRDATVIRQILVK